MLSMFDRNMSLTFELLKEQTWLVKKPARWDILGIGIGIGIILTVGIELIVYWIWKL